MGDFAATVAQFSLKAQAAWAAFKKWQRIDYSTNPKYNIAP